MSTKLTKVEQFEIDEHGNEYQKITEFDEKGEVVSVVID